MNSVVALSETVVHPSSHGTTESAPIASAPLAVGAQLIPIDLIDIPEDRSRDLDEAWAETLAASMAEIGLIKPITVRENGLRWTLVTGLHRLSGAILNGWEAISATPSRAANDDEAKREEIVENIIHAELSALDRAHHLYDLMQVYERMHPELKRGGDQKSASATDRTAIFAIRSEIADRVGLSARAIRLSVAIWKSLSVASRRRCAGTWLAAHQSSLQAISQLTPAIQTKVLDMLLAEKPEATSVADALTIISDGRLPTHVEKKFKAINATLKNLKDAELETVLAVHADRVIETLKRMGRI